jgi:hypothetical protein
MKLMSSVLLLPGLLFYTGRSNYPDWIAIERSNNKFALKNFRQLNHQSTSVLR